MAPRFCANLRCARSTKSPAWASAFPRRWRRGPKSTGLHSESIEATELIVTDAFHGSAEPGMDRRARRAGPFEPAAGGRNCAGGHRLYRRYGRRQTDHAGARRLRLFRDDHLGAAMDAAEVVIWTDVDGVLTADPRLVTEARTIPVISYREAAELAYFGAKVLHPKTLNPVMEAAITVSIRNSFAPEKAGTKITPEGRSIGGGVKALTAIRDVALIAVGGPGIVGVPDVVGRTFSTTADLRANVLLISRSSSQMTFALCRGADAARTVEALRKEFAQDLAHHKVEHVTVVSNIAIVAVVGENMRGTPGVAGRTFAALGREDINLIAIAQGSSESNISFVVEEQAVKKALIATHKEFGLAWRPVKYFSCRGCPAVNTVFSERQVWSSVSRPTFRVQLSSNRW